MVRNYIKEISYAISSKAWLNREKNKIPHLLAPDRLFRLMIDLSVIAKVKVFKK